MCPVPLQVFTLSRTVRTFGTERREGARYSSWLKRLTHLSVRQAAAYLMYLTTNSGLYYLTKARAAPCCCRCCLSQQQQCHGQEGRDLWTMQLRCICGATYGMCRLPSMLTSTMKLNMLLGSWCGCDRRCARCWWAATSA
jgi:hypothetical protein